MNEAGIGRLLVASLHQAIADLLPTRLEFYEAWLNPTGLRDGRIGLAPLAAVLSFLRQEGEQYTLVAARAGEYTAEWWVGGRGPRRGGWWARVRAPAGPASGHVEPRHCDPPRPGRRRVAGRHRRL